MFINNAMSGLPVLLILVAVVAPTIQKEQSEGPANQCGTEEFHEELFVKPLSSGHVNTYFQFTTRWHYDKPSDLHNTHLMPRAIAEILLHYDVKEFHVSLTQGLWRYESWGYPVIDAPPGAEVWAWFSAPNITQTDVNLQWTKLVGTFSGILCASLNFIDGTNSLEPQYSFRPRFGRQQTKVKKFLRYAMLPREIVCTENLTPWKKLLPCNSKHGFASLLNSGHVHNTNFHSLSITMRTICEERSENCILEFRQAANLVYDPKILGSNDISLRRMFGQGLNGRCELARSSKIYVSLDYEDLYELTPPPQKIFSSTRGGSTTNYGIYDIQKESVHRLFNIAWLQRNKGSSSQQLANPFTPKPPIYAHRYILGHGQEHGKLVTQVTNTHHSALSVILQENIPWFVPVYLHTLQLSVVSPMTRQNVNPKAIYFTPGLQRVRPYQLEVAFELPAHTTVQIAIDFDYIFLKWLEYPPDANHGHYIGSAVITTLLPTGQNYSAVPVEGYLFVHSFNDTQNEYLLQIHTESLILSLPTPDFSMPYNVICLACTVVALAFGPIHSAATKKIVIEAMDEPQTIFGKLKKKLFNKRKVTPAEEQKLADDFVSSEDIPVLEGELSGEIHEKSE